MSAKTKVAKPLSEAGDGPTGSQVTLSTGSKVINYTDESVSSGTLMLVPVYDYTGKTAAMSQVPENLPPLTVSADIPKRKVGRCSGVLENLQVVLEDS